MSNLTAVLATAGAIVEGRREDDGVPPRHGSTFPTVNEVYGRCARRCASGAVDRAGARPAARRARRDRCDSRRRVEVIADSGAGDVTTGQHARSIVPAHSVRALRRLRRQTGSGRSCRARSAAFRRTPIPVCSSVARRSTTRASSCCPTISRSCRRSISSRRSSTIRTLFGQIAAANALSDVYAMGGEPLTALNIVGFPAGKLAEPGADRHPARRPGQGPRSRRARRRRSHDHRRGAQVRSLRDRPRASETAAHQREREARRPARPDQAARHRAARDRGETRQAFRGRSAADARRR